MNALLVALGLWSPAYFMPEVHPDGTRTWGVSIDEGDIPKGMTIEQVVGGFISHHNFCPSGWEITNQNKEKKRLLISGRCL